MKCKKTITLDFANYNYGEFEQYQHKERLKLKPPTQADIKKQIQIIKDFNIKCDNVPHFDTIRDLYQWRASVIQQAL